MSSSLTNTSASRTGRKYSLLHGVHGGKDMPDGGADIMAALQMPLSAADIYKASATTVAQGAMAFGRVGPWQTAGQQVALGNNATHVEVKLGLLPASTSIIEDRFVELLRHCFVHVCSVEVLAGMACLLGASWLLYRCVLRRPRVFFGAVGVWSLTLLLDVLVGRGPTACLEDISRRSNEAAQSSGELARSAVRFVAAWLSLMMPVLADIATVLAASWRKLSPQQRLFTLCGVAAVYVIVTTIHAIRRHSSAINKTIFQSSFLIVGPTVWFLSGLLSFECLQWTLKVVLSGLPTILSFHALRRGAVKRDLSGASCFSRLPAAFWTQEEWCELWISFWACWPALMLLKFIAQQLPHLLPNHRSHELLLPSELDRALIVFAVWLQFWQGSQLLNGAVRYTLSSLNASVCAGPVALVSRFTHAMPLRHQFNIVIGIVSGILRNHRTGNVFALIAAALVIGLMTITWTFYNAFRLVCDIMVLVTLCFAAVDSSQIVCSQSKDFYVKRLSFWVLVQIWRTCSQVPLVGSGLSLATPIALTLFSTTGDHLVSWLLIPFAMRLESFPRAVATAITPSSCFRRCFRSKRKFSECSGQGGADEKPEAVLRTPWDTSKNWQMFEQTLFSMFVSPVIDVVGISNISAARAMKVVRADEAAP